MSPTLEERRNKYLRVAPASLDERRQKYLNVAPTASSTNDPVIQDGREIFSVWGREVREEEERVGLIRSLAHGAIAGIIEPFELFGGNADFVKEHERTGMGTLGYGLGYFASFMIPAAATYRVASKGLKSLKWIDEGADLFVHANVLREKTGREILRTVRWKDEALLGAASGALIGAGMTGKDESLGQNVLLGAVTGAIGDPLLGAGMKLAAGLGGRAVAEHIPEAVKNIGLSIILNGRALERVEDINIVARAFSNADEFMGEALPIARMNKESVASVRTKLLDNAEGLGLERLNRLEMRVLRGVIPGEDPHIRRALSQLEDHIDVVRVPRKLEGGLEHTDYLVGLKGELDPKITALYKKRAEGGQTPWWEGMYVKHPSGGVMRVINKFNKGGEEHFRLASVGMYKSKGRFKEGVVEQPVGKVSIVPQVVQRAVPTAPDEGRLLGMFMERNGGSMLAVTRNGDTWDDTFRTFIDEVQGKTTGPQIRWERGGVGQTGAANATVINVPMERIRPVLKTLTNVDEAMDVESSRFLKGAIETRQDIAPPSIDVEIVIPKKGQAWAMRATDIDGRKRILAAEELGRDVIPLQVNVTNLDELPRGVFQDVIEANRWVIPGNKVSQSFGDLELPVYDRPIQELSGPEIAALRTRFVEETVRELGRVDPELTRLLLKKRGMLPKFHESEDLVNLAAQNGYAVGVTIDPATGKLSVLIKDVLPTGTSPGAEIMVQSQERAFNFLAQNQRELPNLAYGINLPNELTPALVGGTRLGAVDGKLGTWQADGATDGLGPSTTQRIKEGLKMGAWWRLAPLIAPREALIREMNDAVIRQTGVDLGMNRAMHEYMQAVDAMRTTMKKGFRPNEGGDGVRGTLGIDELIQVRGGEGPKSRLSGTKKQADALALLQTRNRATRTKIAKEEFGFSDSEIAAIDDLDDFMLRLFEEGQGLGMWRINGDEFMEYYWPLIQNRAIDPASGDWSKALKESLEAQGKKIDDDFVNFQSEMHRVAGADPSFETNPYMLSVRYMRAMASKKHLGEATERMSQTLGEIDRLARTTGNKDLDFIHGQMKGYAEAMVGADPEQYATARVFFSSVFEDMDIQLRPKDFDKVVNTMMSLNYAAFMGLRPGLAIRNLSQILAVTVPLVQDPVALSKAFRLVTTKEGRAAARKAGAIGAEHGIPFEDVLYTGRLYNAMVDSGSAKGRVLSLAQRGRRRLEQAAEVSLGNRSIKVFGQDVKIGFYSGADEFNRAFSFHAMRERARQPVSDFMEGKIGFDEAMKKGGITFMGESHMVEMRRLLEADSSMKKALDYIGVRAAHETQWIYKQGAGPAWMSKGVGRLMGQYGTWPAWFIANLYRGGVALKRDPVGAAKFWGWNMAFSGAVIGATGLTGYDWGKYSPFLTMGWAGGPFFDYAKDASDLISGLDSGDARSQIVASKMGFGAGGWDPLKSAEYFSAPLVPGLLALKEFGRAGGMLADGNVTEAMAKGLLSTSRRDRGDPARLDFSSSFGSSRFGSFGGN